MQKTVKSVFGKYGGVMKTKELRDQGYSDRDIKKWIKNGTVENIRRGYYQYIDDGEYTEASVIAKLFPDGVICMESALDYYGYTERTSSAWNIAVDNKSSRTRFHINYPMVKPHFTETSRFAIGISKESIDGVSMRIYDRERTICDCLRNRNKMDPEVFNDAVRSYIKDPKRNTANLVKYAQELHEDKKVREVLGVWL